MKVIADVVSEVNLTDDVVKGVMDMGAATRHICARKTLFQSLDEVEDCV